MARRLFLLLFSAFIGIIASPEILMASDSFTLAGLNNTGITETVPIVEKAPVVEEVSVVEKAAAEVASSGATVVPAPAPVYVVPQMANYTVSFYINSVGEYTETYRNLSYSGIYKFRKMIYGHNTGNLLGSLANRYVGETFTITEGGVAKNYQVAAIQIYRKTEDGNLETDRGLMTRIANTALGYDVALLTCHGASYGNGDASHRLVVFANAI